MKQHQLPSPNLPQALISCLNCSCDKKKECCKKYKRKGHHCKKCPKL